MLCRIECVAWNRSLLSRLGSARGFFAWTCIIGTGFLLYSIARYSTLGTKVFTAYVLTWFLLVSGVVVVLRHWRNKGDRALLKSSTGLPKWFWPPLWAYRLDCSSAHGWGITGLGATSSFLC